MSVLSRLRSRLRPRSGSAERGGPYAGAHGPSAGAHGPSAGAQLLRAFASARPEAFFVEIGSNDGDQHDHLRPVLLSSRWRGLMVEPVPYVFERLSRNYGDDPRFLLENAAVAERDGSMPLYHLREAAEGEQLPPWYDAIGSFSRDTLVSHSDKIPDIEERIVRTDVRSLSFESLLRKHSVERLDLLLVDTEGHDWEIVRHIDLEARHPSVLVYEHYHLPAAVRREARAHLEAQGYEALEEGFDTWCLDPGADASVTAVWRGLEPAQPAFSADEHPA